MASVPTYAHGPDSQRHEGVPRGKVYAFQHVSSVLPEALRWLWRND